MRNILVPIDFSDISDDVVERAAAIAGARDGKLWLLHVAPPHPDFAGRQLERRVIRDDVPGDLKEVHEKLHERAAKLRARGFEVEAVLVQGQSVDEILAEAAHVGADLIALGSHGHGALYRALVGSVSEGVLRGASCPLLIVPAAKNG